MREITFRAKSKDDGEWLFGDLLYDQYQSFIVTAYDRQTIEVEEETVGQYTGRKDKNGKAIYDGDLLMCQDDTVPYQVHWDDGDCQFRFKYLRFPDDIDISARNSGEFVVVGNIFENPELLETKE